MGSKDYGNDSERDLVCVYEQDSITYLRLAGILENPTGATGTHIKVITLNRDIRITNDAGILVVRFGDVGGPESRFSSALLVLEPDVNPCRLSNPCKQVIRYYEQSAFVDIGVEQTLQLQVCDIIAPTDNDQVILARFPDSCWCIASDISARLVATKDKLAGAADDEIEVDYPTAEFFLINLRRPGARAEPAQ